MATHEQIEALKIDENVFELAEDFPLAFLSFFRNFDVYAIEHTPSRHKKINEFILFCSRFFVTL